MKNLMLIIIMSFATIGCSTTKNMTGATYNNKYENSPSITNIIITTNNGSIKTNEVVSPVPPTTPPSVKPEDIQNKPSYNGGINHGPNPEGYITDGKWNDFIGNYYLMKDNKLIDNRGGIFLIDIEIIDVDTIKITKDGYYQIRLIRSK